MMPRIKINQKIVFHQGNSYLLRWTGAHTDFLGVWVDRMNLYAENGLVDLGTVWLDGHQDRPGEIPAHVLRACRKILATSTATQPQEVQ